ncbi:class I SAM-dependent methyltransferase [Candidatus Zixiibacteriota bacterium]
MHTQTRRQRFAIPIFLLLPLFFTGQLGGPDADTRFVKQIGRDRWENPEAILDTLGIRPGMVIGEVGAGTGYFTFLLSERVGGSGKIYANDINRRSLSTLRARASRNDLANIEIIQGEVEQTNFPAATMDMVVMVYVFHDFTEPLAMMENIKLSLKPGAPVVIIDADHDRIRDRSQHFLSREQLIERVTEAGYELVRIETYLPDDNIYVFKPLT